MYSVGSFSTSAIDGVVQKYAKRGITNSQVFVEFVNSLNRNNIDLNLELNKSPYRNQTDELVDGKINAKYPIEDFIEYVNKTFNTSQKALFKKAEDFYKGFNPSFNVNELRGIDFDMPVIKVVTPRNKVMYQMVTLDKTTDNPRFGSYFFEDISEDITKLGIGDLNRIKTDGRIKIKVILDDEVEFLKSKTANIEDWNGSGAIFDGGGNQYYNPSAKTKIKSFEIIQTY